MSKRNWQRARKHHGFEALSRPTREPGRANGGTVVVFSPLEVALLEGNPTRAITRQFVAEETARIRSGAPAADMVGEVLRSMQNASDRQVIFDSGWYEHRRGTPLPPIESFRVSR